MPDQLLTKQELCLLPYSYFHKHCIKQHQHILFPTLFSTFSLCIFVNCELTSYERNNIIYIFIALCSKSYLAQIGSSCELLIHFDFSFVHLKNKRDSLFANLRILKIHLFDILRTREQMNINKFPVLNIL